MGIEVKQLVVGPVGTNCYVVWREGCDDCVVVDPGASGDRIADIIENEGKKVDAVLLTHGHFDHYEGVSDLVSRTGGKVYILDEEMEFISDPFMNGSKNMMGRATMVKPEYSLRDGEIVEAAGISFKVIHTPGHTPGGCVYYVEDAGVAFVGDTIFMESIGRTDMPGGNMRALLESIKEKIFSLPSETKLLCGHGPSTTVEYEMANNPFA